MLNILNEGYSKDAPIFVSSYDCYLIDNEGNKYIDTTIGSGTHILGHRHSVIVNTIKNQLDIGSLFTVQNNLTYDVGKLIRECVPSIEKVVFCNTGSEATMRAARIARAYTGKKKIALFSGGWHGGNELFLYDFNYDNGDLKTAHKSAGIPDEFKDLVIVLPYNKAQAFEILEKNKDDIAMVIVEPAQGSNPRDDMRDFLLQLRSITKKENIVLCFDEMITGFRVSLGGAQQYYDIEADIVTYGKTIGGGLPVGVVAGKSVVMESIRTNSSNLSVFMGGTMSANPLTMSASKALLGYLLENRVELYEYLSKTSGKFKRGINNFCQDVDAPLRVMGINSMVRLIFTDYPIKSRQDRDNYESDAAVQKEFYNYLFNKKGIFVNSNGIIFFSIKHSDSVVEEMVKSFIEAISVIYRV